MFGSLKTHILEVNGSNTHIFQMFQDFRITRQLFGMLLVPTSPAMKVPCSKGDCSIVWKQC